MRALVLIAVAVLGCHRPRGAAASEPLVPGLAIACFHGSAAGPIGYAIVDDRREVIVGADHRIALVGIDPEVPLASLALLGLAFGPCTRDGLGHDASPVVTCATSARPGRYVVRALYPSHAFAVRALHHVSMIAPDRATVTSQYAVTTPIWQRRATIVLHDGAPGDVVPPREVARGATALDGAVAILTSPVRDVPAQLTRRYTGAVLDRTMPPTTGETWARASQDAIWVWLELQIALPHGAVFAEVTEDDQRHEIDVPDDGRRDGAHVLALPLWIDRELRGGRVRSARSPTTDRIAASIANLGEVARDVWFEEPLRPFANHKLDDLKDYVVLVGKAAVRVKRRVAPGGVDRLAFTIRYGDRPIP